jgi:serine/threonine-protein kinase RsbT
MLIEKEITQSILTSLDIIQARKLVKEWCVEYKFGLTDQTKIVTAASELARNTLDYGLGGTMKMEVVSDALKKGIRLTFTDKGPGIADIALALTDGFTSAKGLGMGLSGSKRLMSDFFIESKINEGTKVTVIKWK